MPDEKNIKNMFMHLTNYSINKESENYKFNKSAEQDNVGHKRSMSAVLEVSFINIPV